MYVALLQVYEDVVDVRVTAVPVSVAWPLPFFVIQARLLLFSLTKMLTPCTSVT